MSVATQWLDVISHNLANVSTTGFKRDEVGFNEGLDRTMAANGGKGQTLGMLGSGPQMHTQYTVMEQGSVTTTGNRTDIAINKPAGMFAVQTPNGVMYTRDGAFTQDSEGTLTTQSGYPLLDRDGKSIVIPAPGAFTVGPTGDVTVNGVKKADIALYDANFEKAGDTLFTASDPRLMDPSEVDVRQGALEQSNVNAITEMVAMIRLNRAFDLAQRSATSQDDASQKLIQALQDR